MTNEQRCVQFLVLTLDAAWRRLSQAERGQGRAEFLQTAQSCATEVTTYSYSLVGLKAGADLLLWRMAPSPEILQETTSLLLQTGLGRYLEVSYLCWGLIRPSVYVRKPSTQEQAIFSTARNRYLIVYPFTKTTDWYLLSLDTRQGMMNEHIRVGKGFPSVQQALIYSFGLDDQEFIVSYETDRLEDFQDLVKALRATEARRYTLKDTPIFVGVHRSLEETLALLG
ncbi:chlorite dismutase family protein [Candidatus Acetothermia bacterium]|jgi:chlorite dismutase|nr:chlorite dismutase family protein [Candidatus Acetothermia bacterium]MCI2432508.1 chlorite dismutase family protein [Candidatus Acetothermia bacterium]MCI2436602.1 chlorite dismutase family protein [Candidatus Acetothermia bacterium]